MKDHKLLYGIYIRSGLVVSLFIIILAFEFVPNISMQPFDKRISQSDILIIDDNFTRTDKKKEHKQLKAQRKPPPVVEPGVENSKGNVETIGETDFNTLKPENRISALEPVPYYKVERPPVPLHITKPRYPPLVLKAGIEGIVLIKGVIDTTGKVIKVEIYKSSGNSLLDSSAVRAFWTYKFRPAKQRGRSVMVWIKMPIEFKIKN